MSAGSQKDRDDAALELCGAMQGLILTGSVPAYMVEFLQARVNKLRAAHGLDKRKRVVRAKEPAHA